MKNKASLVRFRSLGALIAYCNRGRPHNRNKGSHSVHSHFHIRSLAVRSHNSGCIRVASSCSLDSSFGPGLEEEKRSFHHNSETFNTRRRYYDTFLLATLIFSQRVRRIPPRVLLRPP